jgi:hypothetical protein
MQFVNANSTTTCSQIDGTTLGEKLVAQGPQTVGYRFMIGVTPLADDHRYGLRSAALLTSANHYVAPTSASLRAAAVMLAPNDATGTWPIPYEAMATTAAGRSAYPGTMVVYAAVPTSGLDVADATDYATLVRFAATAGQTPGSGVGQLPPGYLPLTAANGLGELRNYALYAANAIAAQRGHVPLVTEAASPPSTTPTTTPTTVPPTTVPPTTVPPTTVATTTPTTAPTHDVALGPTPRIGVGSSGAALGAVLVVALLAALAVASSLLALRRKVRR